jgi:hypothetical protein
MAAPAAPPKRRSRSPLPPPQLSSDRRQSLTQAPDRRGTSTLGPTVLTIRYGPIWSARKRCRPSRIGRRNTWSIAVRPLGPTSFGGPNCLFSNNGDVSVNKTADSSGHSVGMSGMTITERLEPYGFAADPGSWTDWVVVAERVLDSNGTHSWSLLPSDISLDAHWLPIELYRFEGASVSMDFASGTPPGASATPEPSTWAMMLIGLAGLGAAGYRSSRNCRRSIHFPEGLCAR